MALHRWVSLRFRWAAKFEKKERKREEKNKKCLGTVKISFLGNGFFFLLCLYSVFCSHCVHLLIHQGRRESPPSPRRSGGRDGNSSCNSHEPHHTELNPAKSSVSYIKNCGPWLDKDSWKRKNGHMHVHVLRFDRKHWKSLMRRSTFCQNEKQSKIKVFIKCKILFIKKTLGVTNQTCTTFCQKMLGVISLI